MLNEFRRQYPKGCLVSDYLGHKQGVFLVKVIISIEECILGTGLGSGHTLELAEDRARERALSLLELLNSSEEIISSHPAAVTSPSNDLTDSSIQEPTSAGKVVAATAIPEDSLESNQFGSKSSSVPIDTAKSYSAAESTLPFPAEIGEPPLFSEVESQDEPTSVPESMLTPVSSSISESNQPPESTVPANISDEAQSANSLLAASQVARSSLESPSSLLTSEPIDFSEIIAQTNIEMKRLSWTADQGRRHLLQTYGKRSRQLLSDGELLEFLDYLKQQSAA
ncbi:MAG: hypothetical protein AAGG02_10055 [Cyanobacteria bacterium P01_H01_bin.15]